MSKLTVKMIAAAGAVVLACASPLLMAAENQGKMAEQAPQVCMALETDAEVQTPMASEPVSKPRPGPRCLPGQALTCAQMPTPVGGSCSCSSMLLHKKCRTCITGQKGQVLSTTCTVHVPCTSPPCDISQNFSRTAQSCS